MGNVIQASIYYDIFSRLWYIIWKVDDKCLKHNLRHIRNVVKINFRIFQGLKNTENILKKWEISWNKNIETPSSLIHKSKINEYAGVIISKVSQIYTTNYFAFIIIDTNSIAL